MIKGSVVLKPTSYGRWVRIFREWIASGYASMVIHCKDWNEVRSVQKSATGFKYRNDVQFWTHTDGTDLYLINPNAVKTIAMEVEEREDGVVYFYDSAKAF